MGLLTLNATYDGYLEVKTTVYAECHTDTSADNIGDTQDEIYVGQALDGSLSYHVYRTPIIFDLSTVPNSASITAATLKLYGQQDLCVTSEFDVTAVSGTFHNPIVYNDWDDFGSTSFGTINTVSCSVDTWNSITINAAGLTYLNAITNDVLKLGVRSSRDISETTPTGNEYYRFDSVEEGHAPQLDVTYSLWPTNDWPTDPAFPDVGVTDLDTYAVIKRYIEDGVIDIAKVTDGTGDIVFDTLTSVIKWTGTSEQISWDNTNSQVDLTSLEGTSVITFGSLVDVTGTTLTVNTAMSAVDTSVADECTLSVAAYASIKAKIPNQNNLYWRAGGPPAVPNDKMAIYQLSGNGDVIVGIDVSGVEKTHTIADYSAM